MLHRTASLIVSALLAIGLSPATDDSPVVDPALLQSLHFRSIGPLRGGRSTAVTGIDGDHRTFYMGSTGGGVWRTDDAGQTWSNISDGFFEVASIGAIDVADSDANVIWVGTGSACVRGNATTGNGVYRSTDAGATWQHVGLRDAGVIARVIVHPADPDTAWVAALGHPFGPNEERGVFRTRDGGASWERVLFVSEEVGAVDLSLDATNPRVLYAAMWRFERKPWTFYDASEDGGVFKSDDGGSTWRELAGGLPQGITGRIGVSVSPADPQRVWAQVSAADPDGGLWRSDDAGATWRKVNRDRNLRQRHWYYSHVQADPVDRDTVYLMNVSAYRSIDGGVTLERLQPHHGDTHALWIDSIDPDVMILGDDGGAEVTINGGETWSEVLNQPTAEIYRVAVDERFPYRVYGSQQDNSTLSLRSDGRGTPQDWYTVGGCESGHIAIDPRNPDIVYAGCYVGEISRYDHGSGEQRAISAYPVLVDGVAPRELRHRFQWNAPIVVSRHDPGVLLHASQTVNVSRDEGVSWTAISPDLTRNDAEKQDLPGGPLQHDHTSVEVYGTVFVLAESPHEAAEIWTGSDDGLVHVTRDGGASWVNVTPAALPEDATVNSIDLSAHRAGRVTVAAHRYRMDDWAPYVFRSEDGGASWRSLAGGNGLPANYPVRVVREDPGHEGLLFAGTEFGLYASFDDGAHWQPLQGDLPITPVTDLLVHRDDLVISTQGRGFWILDGLEPLRAIAAGEADADVALLAPGAARRAAGDGGRPATIHYRLPGEVEASLEVVDSRDRVARRWATAGTDARLPAGAGLQQVTWDLRYPGASLQEGAILYLGYGGGPIALPGDYTVRLRVGEQVLEHPLRVLADPRRPEVSLEDLDATRQLSERIQDLLQRSHDAIGTLRSVRKQTAEVAQRATGVSAEVAPELEARAARMSERLTAIEQVLIQTKAEARQDPINFPPMLDTQIGYLYRYVAFTYDAPGAPAYERLAEVEAALLLQEEALRSVLQEELPAFNGLVREAGLDGVVLRR